MFNNNVKRYRSFGSSQGGNSTRPQGGFSSRRPQFGGGNRFAKRQSQLIGQDINMFIKKASSDTIESPTYIPHNSFSDFNISSPLKSNILNKGYKEPTPIQDQAIEPILEGRDLIGLANTGTGKTAAFLIPIIDKIFKNRNEKALIIAPTRELAVQIEEEFRAFSKNMHLYSALVIGGANAQRQIHIIRRNPHLVIGTPGRLKDLIDRRVLHLEDFSIFVLDEVDLMVDIGFIQDVKYFVSLLPPVRQSLFFSATINPKVSDILQDFVKDPVTVSVRQGSTSDNVDQDVIKVVSREKKIDQLHDVLIQKGSEKVLIFGRTKHSVDKLNNELTYRGFKTGAIHGNKSQGQRRRVLDSFKQNQIQVLLATDVASRGLDIPDVTHVINYELPDTYDDYVHRIGRTGRANKKGIALTFID